MNDDRSSALDGGLGGALLRAGRDDWPSDAALSRTLSAVGVSAAVIAVTSGAAASAGASVGTAAKGGAVLISFGTVMKWLGVGVVSGVVVAGVAHEISVPARAPLEAKPVAAAPPAPPHRAAEKAVPSPRPEPIATTAPTAPPPTPSGAPRSAVHPDSEQSEPRAPLAAEVALVDRARARLSQGNPGLALEALAGYETTFPDPRLQPEVLYIRMEAHLAAGNAARASETAAQSLRLFPRSPHSARARSILEKYPGAVETKKN